MNENKTWYFVADNERIGPKSTEELRTLIRQNTITKNTMVWNSNMPEWVAASQTNLFDGVYDEKNPPPISGSNINNSIVWVLAFAPWIGGIIEGAISELCNIPIEKLWLITVGLNIGLCYLDDKILIKGGHNTQNLTGWVFLVPVYLYKRARMLNQNLAYFILWCITLLLLLIAD